MKKVFILLTTCLVSLCLYAQDIIVTIDANKIEAKILEVSKTEIRYKEADYLDGPTFILSTNDINSIIFSNGKVILYNHTPANHFNKQEVQVLDNNTNGQWNQGDSISIFMVGGEYVFAKIVNLDSEGVVYSLYDEKWFIPANKLVKIVFNKTGKVQIFNEESDDVHDNEFEEPEDGSFDSRLAGYEIYREGGNTYVYGNTYISSKEVERILQRQDPYAYEQWRKGNGLEIAGGVFIGIGCGLALGGLFPLFTGNYILCLGLSCSSFLPLGLGLGLTLGGSAMRNKAIDIYNTNLDNATIQLNFFTSPSEVGIALSF